MKRLFALVLAVLAMGTVGGQTTGYILSGATYTATAGTYAGKTGITGSFITSAPLAANLVNSPIATGTGGLGQVSSYSFNDGVYTYTNSNSSISAGDGSNYIVSTNGAGTITGFLIKLTQPATGVLTSPANFMSIEPGTLGAGYGICNALTSGTCTAWVSFAADSASNGAATAAFADATVPATPATPTATAGNSQVSVAFVAPANNGSAITGYTATSSPGGFTSSGCTTSPCVVTGLTNGTTYTFTVKATNAVGTGAASPASNSVTPSAVPSAPAAPSATPGIGQATVTFVAPLSNGNPISGYTVTSSPAGGVDSDAGTTTLTHTITSLNNGVSYTFTVTATNATGTSAASAVSNAVVPNVIPILTISVPGLGTKPNIANLKVGDGPGFAIDLAILLSSATGTTLRFVEQTSTGTVVLGGYNNGNLAFIPHNYQSGDTRANGLYPVGNGQYRAVVNGKSLDIAPAVVHLDQLAALLDRLEMSMDDSGVLNANVHSVRYAIVPSVVVAPEAATGAARLDVGADGNYRFIDAQGNNQTLYPAFSEAATVRSILQGLDSAATLAIQLDGTASIVFQGTVFILAPDVNLLSTVGSTWWQDASTHYRYNTQQTRGNSQGFSVRR